jgi:hypothetical protein
MTSADTNPRQWSHVHAIAMVTDVAERAEKVADALRALREPEAAAAVAELAHDAARAARMLAGLLDPEPPGPEETENYRFHRDLWVRYGDPGDLEAMTEHVTDRRPQARPDDPAAQPHPQAP